jgi:hypothetical protein
MAECIGLAVTLVVWMLLVATAQARELKQIKYSSIPDVLLRQPELSIFLDAVMVSLQKEKKILGSTEQELARIWGR